MDNRTLATALTALAVAGLLVTGCATTPSQGRKDTPAVIAPTHASTPTSAGATATTGGATTDLGFYRNEAYGFSFQYPLGWEVMLGRNFVRLRQGEARLVIGYRHVTGDPNICCREQFPEGELVRAGTVLCAGEEVDRTLLTCDGRTKAVIYEGSGEIALGDLRFLFYLEDFRADYDAADIAEDVQAQVDRIIASLQVFEPAEDFEAPTARPTRLPPTPPPTDEPPSAPTAIPPTATPRPGLAEAVPGGANVRSGPGTHYGLQGFLDGGEQVDVVGQHGDWWQIVHAGRPAWVYDGVVDVSNTDAVPQVASVPTPVPSSPAVIPTAAPPSTVQEDRWIDVNLGQQRLTAYENGEPVRSTLVSTGLPQTPTVTGQFRIWIKLRYDDMEGADYYLEDVPHVMYFYQGYGLHAAPWHNNFGQPMSHGCVNLPLPEAEWLFDFADVGTLVNVRE